jgi:hypothetical protein
MLLRSALSARPRAISAFVRIFGASLLFIAALLSPVIAPVLAETTISTDTPVPVVNDIAEEWAAGGGLLYWANSCFAEEFPPPSILKRKPIAGGTIQTLDQTQSDNCLTYLNIAAADDGVYYITTMTRRTAWSAFRPARPSRRW